MGSAAPLVTVLIATRNQAEFLPAALDSVRAQTFDAALLEVLVIDDGSTDQTASVLRGYQDWIRAVERPHRGLVVTCNDGLALARGRYLVRLDSDDLVAPDWVARLMAAATAEPEAACVYSDRYELRGADRDYVRVDAANLYTLQACGVLARTDLLRRIGGFRPLFWEEYDLFLRLRPCGRFVRVPVPLYSYRRHAGAMTSDASHRHDGWRELAAHWGRDALLAAGPNPELAEALLHEPASSRPRKTLIVAEIGENHGGDWSLARRMVVEAAQAGADIVKFQSYCGADVAADDPERDWFTRVALPDREHVALKALAEQHGIRFLTAPFSVERARFVVERLGLREIKVASSEMTNDALLAYLNGRVDTVFLSTGMAALDEIATAVEHLSAVPSLYLLQCTTEYPCPVEHANLGVINALRRAFPRCSVGYSDHTVGILAPLVAASLGASVIEKHFTLDRMLPGTDHVLSVTPSELADLVRQIRTIEVLLHDGVKRPSPAEAEVRDAVRARFAKGPQTEGRRAS